MSLSLGQIVELLEGADAADLFAEARRVRERVFGKFVFLRGVVEFSSYCRKQCLYCGLRAANASLARYRLREDQMLDAARMAVDLGMGTVVLQSGEEPDFSSDLLERVTARIKETLGAAVTLSVGDAPDEALARFRRAGADRYLLKVETMDASLYAGLRPGDILEKRLDRLEALRSHGFEVGSGVIIGLPGQDPASLARDILALTALQLDMIAVGPLVAHPDTPLAGAPHGSVAVCLRALAILRLLNPLANIPATSALQALAPDGRARGLRAGCNVIMPSLTPQDVRGRYAIYPGKNIDPGIEKNIAGVKRVIRAEGLIPSDAPGPSPRRLHEPGSPPRGAVGHHAAGPA
ncbi:MAG: [FeFe] hydrogenase H-cluster radical SAM maturase HydE [Desulfovibrionaceae bacterium]